MKYVTYILEDDNGKKYKGVTNNLGRRIGEHVRGKTITTSRMSNLRIVYTEEFDTFEEARKREVYFKTAAGRRYIKKKLGV